MSSVDGPFASLIGFLSWLLFWGFELLLVLLHGVSALFCLQGPLVFEDGH